MIISRRSNEFNYGYYVGNDQHPRLITVERAIDIRTMEFAKATVNWPALGTVSEETATEFKDMLVKAVQLARHLDSALPRKFRARATSSSGKDIVFDTYAPSRFYVDLELREHGYTDIRIEEVRHVTENESAVD